MKKASISWSGGKDSAFALYQVLQETELNDYIFNVYFDFDLKVKRRISGRRLK